MLYALDSDVLVNLLRSGLDQGVIALGKLPVVITDVVWDELTVSTPTKPIAIGRIHAASALMSSMANSSTAIHPNSPEALTFNRLQGAVATQDRGEHATMALALHDPDVVPVLYDRRALHRAVEELRWRKLLSIHGFVGILRDEFGLDKVAANQFSRWLCQSNATLRPPLWW